MDTIRIYIGTPRYGRRGGLYDARLSRADGDLLVTATTEPLLASARMLHAQGIKGRLEMWDSDNAYPRVTGSIAKMARLTVVEGDRQSPAFRRYVERPNDGHLNHEPSPYPKPSNARSSADEQRAIGALAGAEA